MTRMTPRQVKDAYRNPSQYAFSEYFLCADGSIISRASFLKEIRLILHAAMFPEYLNKQWTVVGRDINYEDLELRCEHTGDEIEAAYAGK